MSKYITDKRFTLMLLLLIFIILLTFFIIIFWPSVIYPEIAMHRTLQFTATITPTLTPLPANFSNIPKEYVENQDISNGLLIGSVVMVSIILLGVLISIRNNEK